MAFAYDGKKGEVGKGGEYVMKVDGAEIARTRIDRTVPYIYSVDETLDVGEDRGTPILEDYADRMPFAYTGRSPRSISTSGPRMSTRTLASPTRRPAHDFGIEG